jgi:hypothetical protein
MRRFSCAAKGEISNDDGGQFSRFRFDESLVVEGMAQA